MKLPRTRNRSTERPLIDDAFDAYLDWREASLLRAMALETVRFLERSGTPFELPEGLQDVGRTPQGKEGQGEAPESPIP